MDAALYASALALGLAGAPHCVAMCAAPCAAVTGGRTIGTQLAFHLSRAASYALAGALAAASVNALALLGSVSPIFRPLWTMVHAAVFGLGLWLALVGRQPEWLERIGRSGQGLRAGAQGARRGGSGRAIVAGALWVAWPCGLLQSAVLVAALADTPWAGAGVMAVFALATGFGLTAVPWLWRRLGSQPTALMGGTAGVRLAGVMLAIAAIFALWSDLWPKVLAYCGF
ncbi:MAG TPA: sulfite exporter TauE/SafE family protein [Rubrivivax sp.]|nr:sulfite exporter TauE/SafE family protein [Rubrivivax sp.]